MDAGREDEAYQRFGLLAAEGTTNLARFRHLTKRYATRNARQILNDLISASSRPGKWFAAAKDAGFLDLALECAQDREADPSTLIRAARDFTESEPAFATRVAVCALRNLLVGGGYEPTPLDVLQAHRHLRNASELAGMQEWANEQVERMLKSSSGRGLLWDALQREHLRQ